MPTAQSSSSAAAGGGSLPRRLQFPTQLPRNRIALATGQPCVPRLQHHWATPSAGHRGGPPEPGVGGPLPEPGVRGDPSPPRAPATAVRAPSGPAPRAGRPRAAGSGAARAWRWGRRASAPARPRGTYPCSPSPGTAGRRGRPRPPLTPPRSPPRAPRRRRGVAAGDTLGAASPRFLSADGAGRGARLRCSAGRRDDPPGGSPLRAPLPPRAPPRPRTDPEAAAAAPRGALPRPGRERTRPRCRPRGGGVSGVGSRAGRGGDGVWATPRGRVRGAHGRPALPGVRHGRLHRHQFPK